jgi:spore coat protein CotH
MKRAATTLSGLLLAVVVWAGPAAAQAADDLFASQDLQRMDLWVHSADWAKLKADFQSNTYYPADLTFNGQTVRNIGIRSRGRGSRSATKPGLRVDFDRYTSQQTFLGLKSFILDNVTQDPSGVHESVAMALYARLGIPAPREIHTRLYVNNEYIGVYVIVESVDKDLLARVFGVIGDDTQNDGYLYEFKWQDEWKFAYLGSGLNEYKVRFEPTTHESAPDEELYRPIEELVRVVNDTPSSDLPAALAGRLDVPAFIRFVVAQIFLAEIDGFVGAFGINNLYLYRLENSTVHTMIAWDADNTFHSVDFPTNTEINDNILTRKLMEVPEYAALFRAELERTVQLAEADDWLNTEIIRHVQRIDTAMKEDPSKPYSTNTYEGAAGDMLNFARARISFVKCELERGAGNTSCRP